MSDYKFNCPNCNQSLEAPEDMRGQTIECPACNGSIQLPARAPSPSPLSDVPRHQDPEPEYDSDAATYKQIAYIRDLGGTVPPGLTKEKASEMIDALRNSAPPTQKQRDLVQKLGGTIPVGLTAAQASDFISELDGNQPPTKQQIKFIKMLGGDVPGTKREASERCKTLESTALATAQQKGQAQEMGLELPPNATFAQAGSLLDAAERDADEEEGKPPTQAQSKRIAKLGGDPQKAKNQWRADEYIEELENEEEEFKFRVDDAIDFMFGDADTRSMMSVRKPPRTVMEKAIRYGEAQGWGDGWEDAGRKSDLNPFALMDVAVYAVAPDLLKQNETPPRMPSRKPPVQPQARPSATGAQGRGVKKIILHRTATAPRERASAPSPGIPPKGKGCLVALLLLLTAGSLVLLIIFNLMASRRGALDRMANKAFTR